MFADNFAPQQNYFIVNVLKALRLTFSNDFVSRVRIVYVCCGQRNVLKQDTTLSQVTINWGEETN